MGIAAAAATPTAKRQRVPASPTLMLYLIATCGPDNIVLTDNNKGSMLVINTSWSENNDNERLAHELTKDGLSGLPDGMAPYRNFKLLANHANTPQYAANQLPGWEEAKGRCVPIFNKAHLLRVILAAKALFPAHECKPDVIPDAYDISNDPTVYIVNVKNADGTSIDGNDTDYIVLDTCGKRSLHLMW